LEPDEKLLASLHDVHRAILGIPSYNFIFEIIYITPSILDCCKETGNPDISFTLLISREKLLSLERTKKKM
jgi:hypothetical protein